MIRGPEHEPSIEEIEHELKSVNLKFIKVYAMKSGKQVEALSRALYLIVTPEQHRLSELNKRLKYFLHTKVTWELFSATGVRLGGMSRQTAG